VERKREQSRFYQASALCLIGWCSEITEAAGLEKYNDVSFEYVESEVLCKDSWGDGEVEEGQGSWGERLGLKRYIDRVVISI
jgi:hypothetical protein